MQEISQLIPYRDKDFIIRQEILKNEKMPTYFRVILYRKNSKSKE